MKLHELAIELEGEDPQLDVMIEDDEGVLAVPLEVRFDRNNGYVVIVVDHKV